MRSAKACEGKLDVPGKLSTIGSGKPSIGGAQAFRYRLCQDPPRGSSHVEGDSRHQWCNQRSIFGEILRGDALAVHEDLDLEHIGRPHADAPDGQREVIVALAETVERDRKR